MLNSYQYRTLQKHVLRERVTTNHWAKIQPYVGPSHISEHICIDGKHFLVRTDHRPLSYLFSMKNPSSKLIRMRMDLKEYDFIVESRITTNGFKKINEKVSSMVIVTLRSLAANKEISKIIH